MGGTGGVRHGDGSLSVLCINISPDVDYCKGKLGIIAAQRKHARQIIDVQERQAMWVRAVAVAVAVACCAVTAQAAQYAEVWNPPEARHAPKKVKMHASAGKKVAVKGEAAARSKRQKAEPKKKASVHASHEAKSHSRLAAKSAPGKPVKTARIKGAPKQSVKMAHARDAKGMPTKVVKTAHAKTAHVQTAMHSKSQKAAVRSASTQPAAAMTSPTARAVPNQPASTMVNTAANPAANSTAGSSGLPPILH
jgi:hypothetical protein